MWLMAQGNAYLLTASKTFDLIKTAGTAQIRPCRDDRTTLRPEGGGIPSTSASTPFGAGARARTSAQYGDFIDGPGGPWGNKT
jgi:hypothetical protein